MTEEKYQASLEQLPPEIHLLLCQYINVKQQIYLSQTSTKLREFYNPHSFQKVLLFPPLEKEVLSGSLGLKPYKRQILTELPERCDKSEVFYHEDSIVKDIFAPVDKKETETAPAVDEKKNLDHKYLNLITCDKQPNPFYSSYFRAVPFKVFARPEKYSWYSNKAIVEIRSFGKYRKEPSFWRSWDDPLIIEQCPIPPYDYTSLSSHYPNLSIFKYNDIIDKCNLYFNPITNDNPKKIPACPRMYSTQDLLFLMKEDPATMGAACFFQVSTPHSPFSNFADTENIELSSSNVQWGYFLNGSKWSSNYLTSLTIQMSFTHLYSLNKNNVSEIIKFENFPNLQLLIVWNMFADNDPEINRYNLQLLDSAKKCKSLKQFELKYKLLNDHRVLFPKEITGEGHEDPLDSFFF